MGIAAKTPDLAMLTSANVGAINFNGSTSYIEYTNNAFGNFGSALTISFWIKPEYLSTVIFPVIIGVPTGGSNTGTQFITLRSMTHPHMVSLLTLKEVVIQVLTSQCWVTTQT